MILVTGATGFLGKRICQLLTQRKIPHTVSSRSLGTDLMDREQTRTLLRTTQPKYVFNCAALVGGIQFGYKHPGRLFYENTIMGLNLLEACREFKVGRLINPVSNCIYPGRAVLFKEDELWEGPMHESVLSYGGARKGLWIGSWGYGKEYGMDIISLVLPNLYGPGDHFEAERSHALGALIMKFAKAKKEKAPEVIIWGSGKPIREWMHVDDAAEAMLRTLESPATLDPFNVGISSGVTVAELAQLIANAFEYTGKLVYDTSKPDGAMCKTIDGQRGEKYLNWKPRVSLEEGLRGTVEWYNSHYSN